MIQFSRSTFISQAFILLFVMNAHATEGSTRSEHSSNPYGIGVISASNQEEFERFEGAFYVGYGRNTLVRNTAQSDNQNYTTTFNSKAVNGFDLGVRHPITSFGRFALLGDYSVGAHWAEGSFQSKDFTVSEASSKSSLLSISLTPALLFAYFITERIHPFIGFAGSEIYSRLQSSLSGGDNEFFEFHYGPTIGVQFVNLPLQQLFVSVEWIQFMNQAESAQRIYADAGRAELAVGLNF